MSDLRPFSHNALLPVEPRIDFTIRVATLDDFEWIDAMQKAETDKLGFLMKMAIEKRIEQGNVLVAEGVEPRRHEEHEARPEKDHSGSNSEKYSTGGSASRTSRLRGSMVPLGYCIAVDRYMKQDHVGQFVQLNVPPAHRRSLVGAALVKATFEKAAYGVKLYGLWCRQDLAANRFWESLGFVPLAFRAAGISTLEKIKRKTGGTSGGVHIYWQRRIREGDEGSGATAYWFPYETQGGMMAESRLVLPIPLGTHWEDAKPVILPGAERRAQEVRLLEADQEAKAQADKAALAEKRKEARAAAKEAKRLAAPGTPRLVHGVEVSRDRGAGVPLGFDLPPEAKAQRAAEEKAAAAAAKKARIKEEKRAAKRAAKQARRKTDPEMLAYARELRDRWQEHVTMNPLMLEGKQNGRYTVGRLLEVVHGQPPNSHNAHQATVMEPKRLDAA